MSTPPSLEQPRVYVLLGTIAVWVGSDLYVSWRVEGHSERSDDRGSKYAIGAAVVGGIWGATVLPTVVSVPVMPFPRAAFWAGIGLVLIGVVVRQYAVATLGEYFSLEVAVDATDTVVSSGPYRWVRHPSYTGGLASLVGVGLAAGNWVSLAIVVVAGLLGYGYRRVEERALRDELGDAYEAYAERTPYRLVPLVW